MLLETIVDLFCHKHYPESTYEVRKRSGDVCIVVAVDTEDTYFNIIFDLIDADKKKFSAFCNHATPRSFAYAVDQQDRLVDIKGSLFSAQEILHHMDVYDEQRDEIDTFLSDPNNAAMFFEKLTCCRNSHGNLWSIELNPMYSEPRLDDMFASMSSLSMLWDRENGRFKIYNGHDFLQQSSIDYTNGVVTINGKILFLILNPGAAFYVTQYVPEEGAEELLVYEGEIAAGLGATDSSALIACRLTISNLNKLPAADILMEWGDRKIEAKAPLLLINDGRGGLIHFTLKRPEPEKVLAEVVSIVEKNVSGEVARFHLNGLREMDLL